MLNPLPFIVAGIVTGSVYGLAGMGLALSYRMTRVLNFAHGAVAMLAGFLYWQLNTDWNWPALLAFPIAVVIAPTALALVSDRWIFRGLRNSSVFAKTAATVSMLLLFLGTATHLWRTNTPSPVSLFPKKFYDLPGVTVSAEQIGMVATVAVMSLASFLVFRYTPIGLQLRASVDNEELASMRGLDPNRLTQISWSTSYVFAGVSGVLLAPLYGGSSVQLTLVVVFSLVALVIGRMESLPLTLAGGLLVGLADSLAIGYLPSGQLTSSIRGSLPFVILFGALVVLGKRFSAGSSQSRDSLAWLKDTGSGSRRLKEPGIKGIVTVFGLASVVAVSGSFWSYIVATGVAYAIIFLSYKFFTSVTGMATLAQAAFAGIGAFSAAIFVGGSCSGGDVLLAVGNCYAFPFSFPWPLAVIAGGVLAGLVGLFVALPTVRLRGIFLILSTVAFAQLVETVVFNQESLTGGTYGRSFARPSFLSSDQAYLLFALAVFLLLGWLADSVRRSKLGLELQAYLGSDNGARSVGIRPERGRMLAFMLAAFIAGVGGSVFAAVNQRVAVESWSLVNALLWLTLTAIGGVASMWGSLGVGVALALLPQLILRVPGLSTLQMVLFGFLGLLLLSRAGGMVGLIDSVTTRLAGPFRHQNPSSEGPPPGRLPRLSVE